MNGLILCILVYLGFIIAYKTYGRFLARRLFSLDRKAITPAQELNDGIDYVPTKKEILFGHHFTSIAGTGPIVGPAIGVIWGWVPALIWVVVGSIVMGAVHDFGSLVISARNKGKSIGETTKEIVSPTSRILFLLVIFFCLVIVISIFAMIIGLLFRLYPTSVFPVWMEIPIAILLGHLVYQKNANVTILSLLAIVLMYITIWIGTYLPIQTPSLITWVIILMIYAYIASVLPVQTLLQPRDYINAHELMVAMGLLFLGLLFAHPNISAPAIVPAPKNAPPVWPFLFITVACGAISGFHSLVSSGTTSKQLDNETHAQFIGYGGMLMEGALATIVIIACVAGLGDQLAWSSRYADWASASGLGAKLSAFIDGGTTFLTALGISKTFAATILGVFIVSFAATTLDTATRIQRYVVTELAQDFNITPFKNRYLATGLVIITAFLLAMARPDGKGALILWPLFGASNQLLAGIALLVITVYLWHKKKPIVYTALPMVFMVIMTGWAMVLNIRNFYQKGNWLLFIINGFIIIFVVWMIVEVIRVVGRARKVSPE
ncbi:carbon starvation protein A [candidate division WOR-3 bacterium]|uniref:Carbon starvation protein A n=1 Tax=candidate division WOR-3 bacterium TaxID=2052148 RepID=A0A660SKI4_UNCW3|nr:MAG: carbon starvation protein A [candidate division WOR-3 bacterium]